MSAAPLPVACPACHYIPAGRQVICTNCGHDKSAPQMCHYERDRVCDCGGRNWCIEAA